MYDFVIIGAGLFGTTFGRTMAERNKKILILDKRPHIGGNCYTKNENGINVHVYGPHIFHTNNEKVWAFINQYATFNNYIHTCKVNYKDKIYSFPINLLTLNQLWGIKTPQEAKEKLKQLGIADDRDNLKSWSISQVGQELYEIFIEGYTQKQWNKSPEELPSSIIKRIPIRTNYDARYFSDRYQGIPIGGYTRIFEKMLDHPNIELQLSTDYFENKYIFNRLGKQVVYTGKIDEFFNYAYGPLEYRSLKFETEVHNCRDYQGCSIVNYTHSSVPYTRIVEHKHFEFGNQPHTVITKEYPLTHSEDNIPYYPVCDERNVKKYYKYKEASKSANVIFGGRLGSFKYFDMDQILAAALKLTNRFS